MSSNTCWPLGLVKAARISIAHTSVPVATYAFRSRTCLSRPVSIWFPPDERKATMTVVPSRRPACGKQFALSFRFVKGEPTVGHEGGNPRDGGNYNCPRFLRAARV